MNAALRSFIVILLSGIAGALAENPSPVPSPESPDDSISPELLEALDNAPSVCLDPGRIAPSESPTANERRKFEGNPIKFRRMIDGPANFRYRPDGKILGQFGDQLVVLLEAQRGDWYFVRGYWEKTCDAGWTKRNNFRPMTDFRMLSEAESENVFASNAYGVAFRAYFNDPKGPGIAEGLAESTLKRLGPCKYRGSRGSCATAAHLMNSLLARIAYDRGDKKSAESLLLRSATFPEDSSIATIGPCMGLARYLFDKGEKSMVTQFIERLKKSWVHSAEEVSANSWKELPAPSPFPDLWLSEIRAGKNPTFERAKHLEWVWRKESWKPVP